MCLEGAGRKLIRVSLARLREAPGKLLIAACPGSRVREGAPYHSSMAAVCSHTAMNAANMVSSMTRDNPTVWRERHKSTELLWHTWVPHLSLRYSRNLPGEISTEAMWENGM